MEVGKWALHLLHRIQSGCSGGGTSAQGVSDVVGCVHSAVGAGEGGDGDGPGDEAGEGEGRSESECKINSDVSMAGGISGVCSVIHSSVDVLGAMVLLVGVEDVRSEHLEVSLPSSWAILRRLAMTTDLLLACMASALESVLARFCG